MARANFRLDPFLNEFFPVTISEEQHYIPSNSPFVIWLSEIPQKTDPSSMVCTIGGTPLTEVSAEPQAGEFWPDYSTNANNDTGWNTGRIKFHASRAGQLVKVSYLGLGTSVHINNTAYQVQSWTAPGTYTWVVPQGVFRVRVTLVGGGGGGRHGQRNGDGGEGTTYWTLHGGFAGSRGQILLNQIVSTVPGETITVTVGAGGIGSYVTGSGLNQVFHPGAAGGSSSFGALYVAGGAGASEYADFSEIVSWKGVVFSENCIPLPGILGVYGMGGRGKLNSTSPGNAGNPGMAQVEWGGF